MKNRHFLVVMVVVLVIVMSFSLIACKADKKNTDEGSNGTTTEETPAPNPDEGGSESGGNSEADAMSEVERIKNAIVDAVKDVNTTMEIVQKFGNNMQTKAIDLKYVKYLEFVFENADTASEVLYANVTLDDGAKKRIDFPSDVQNKYKRFAFYFKEYKFFYDIIWYIDFEPTPETQWRISEMVPDAVDETKTYSNKQDEARALAEKLKAVIENAPDDAATDAVTDGLTDTAKMLLTHFRNPKYIKDFRFYPILTEEAMNDLKLVVTYKDNTRDILDLNIGISMEKFMELNVILINQFIALPDDWLFDSMSELNAVLIPTVIGQASRNKGAVENVKTALTDAYNAWHADTPDRVNMTPEELVAELDKIYIDYNIILKKITIKYDAKNDQYIVYCSFVNGLDRGDEDTYSAVNKEIKLTKEDIALTYTNNAWTYTLI